MTIHRQYLCMFLFCFLQLLALFLYTFFLRCDHPMVTTKPVESSLDWEYATSILERKSTESTTSGKSYVKSVLKRNVDLEYENSLLRELLRKQTTEKQQVKDTTREEAVPKPLLNEKKRKNDDIRIRSSTFYKLVTIILYEEVKTSPSCFEARKEQLQSQFPHLNILYTKDASTVGRTFNQLFPKVTTKYFYFLNTQSELFTKKVGNQDYGLLEALEEVPELDFISGSILNDDKLEIPCYRLNICNWTFSQKYEYRRSINEIMICDNIGVSFMGKARSVRNIFLGNEKIFDEEMKSLATTDFFLRVKKAGATCGVRPEVMVKVIKDQRCHANTTENKLKQYQNLLPFAHKHKVFRFKDPESRTLDLCGDGSPILGTDICSEPIAHEVMLNGGHWAKMGTFAYPYILDNLQKCLFEVTELLNSKNISYYVEGGVALGAIKMKSILPWDAGDVDLVIHHHSSSKFTSIIKSFALERNYTFKEPSDANLYQVFCVSGMEDKMGGLVTMSLEEEEELDELIKIKTNGHWISYKHEIFKQMRQQYGMNYLQHVVYKSKRNEKIHCKMKGHNACLPDFRENAGKYNELFCQV